MDWVEGLRASTRVNVNKRGSQADHRVQPGQEYGLDEDARLRRSVAAALPGPVGVPVGAALSIRRAAGLPLVVHVHPIHVRRMDFGAERLAVLVMSATRTPIAWTLASCARCSA